MSMKIGMVARTLNSPHLRGTGRYVRELLRNIQPADEVEWTAFAHNPAQPFRVPQNMVGKCDVFEFRGDRFELWEQIGLPLHAQRAGVQVLHCAENTVPLWQPMPIVVTIHDTILWEEARPTWLDHHYLHHVQNLAYRRCAAVITISESSRRDIAARWPFLADRITVIPHGIAEEFLTTDPALPPQFLQQAVGQSRFLLYVGGPQPRKRFSWALELLAACGRPDMHLVAVGFGAGDSTPSRVPSDLAGRVHMAPFLNEKDLVALYRLASAVVYPTLYEGFGFPAVEAQAAGTPVLFSPVSSLADLIGPLAWPVPTQDMARWRAALTEALDLTVSARVERAAAARGWANQFSWRKTAEAHLLVYERALKPRAVR